MLWASVFPQRQENLEIKIAMEKSLAIETVIHLQTFRKPGICEDMYSAKVSTLPVTPVSQTIEVD